MALFRAGADPQQLPAAAYSYLGDFGSPPGGFVLRADPVHLRADTRGLVLFDAGGFPFGEQESAALSGSVHEFFLQDGWHLTAASPRHWYLSADISQSVQTTPLSRVRGQFISAFLPTGVDAGAWLQRLNEVQMLMYSHPVNQARAARGEPLVNSLWLWGGGELQAGIRSPFNRVYSGSALLKGLCAAGSIDCAAVPAHADDVLTDGRTPASILIHLDGCSAAAAYQDLGQWNTAIDACERNWFEPLLKALLRRRIHSLQLLALDGYRYSAGWLDTRCFWRQDRPYHRTLAVTG